MAPLYYRDAVGALLVYDVTDKQSFNSLDYWIKELDDFIKDEKMKVAIMGNKSDMPPDQKKVPEQTLKQFAENIISSPIDCYGECSAKNGEGVSRIFQ